MTVIRALATRVKLLLVPTVALTLVGAGAAAAYWTATASLDGSADAAAVGLSQTEPLELATTYDAGTLLAADAVTITNTGEREASVQTTVGAAGDRGLSGALDVRIAEIATEEECAPSTELADAVTGGPGLTFAPTPTLPAGESILVCVQTSLIPQELFSLPAGAAQVTVTSTLTYAKGAQWSLSEEAGIAQDLATDRASGAPRTTCTGDSGWRLDDTLTFGLGDGISADPATVRAFVVKNREISELGSSEITVNAASGSVRIDEDTLRDRARGLGPAQVVITQGSDTGTRTIVGVGRVDYHSLLSWNWFTHVSCR